MEQLFKQFHDLGIEFDRYDHPPVTTVDEAMTYLGALPGTKVKNLIFQDKSKNYFLIIAKVDTKININNIAKKFKIIGIKKADYEVLEYLKIDHGAVCPFAMINDIDKKFTVFIEEDISGEKILMFHPLQNNVSINISLNNLQKYMNFLGYNLERF